VTVPSTVGDKRRRPQPREGGVALLHQRTEGWAAGLRLAVISLDGHPDPERFVAEFSGSDRTVAEYLLAEMLDRQRPDVQDLLLRTSLLDRVNGELATALFALFFFLTLFIQNVLGYSAIRSGVAYLPFAIGVVLASALAAPLVPRIGPRPLILAGTAMVAGGMFWFSRLTDHAATSSICSGPQLISSFGLGLVFVPLSLVALHNVAEQDSVSPPACSTRASRSAARSGLPCSAPSPGRPSRTAPGLSSRTRRRPPRRRADPCRSRAPPRLRPSTITP
jgi:hypothetical protein